MLTTLELEYNDLTGSIPELNNLSGLREFNVSYNRLNGSIPSGLSKFPNDSFLGNALCGSPLAACPSNNDGHGNGGGAKKLSTGAIVGIVLGSVIGLILILLVLFFLLRKRSSPQSTASPQVETPPPGKPHVIDVEPYSPKPLIVREASGGDTVVVNRVHGGRGDGLVFFGEGSATFALEDLLRAPAEVLGKGTFGSTYKVYLEGETEEVVVVVKRLRDVCVSEREFREKVEDFGLLVHANLVPFRAYYCGKEEKLIVFDCMPMGSLSALLHGEYCYISSSFWHWVYSLLPFRVMPELLIFFS